MSSPVLLALDLDGTVLDDRRRFTPNTLKTVQMLRRQGILVCFVTGRRIVDMIPLGKHAEAVDYLILNSGSHILDMKGKQILRKDVIPRETAEKIVRHALDKKAQLSVNAGRYWGVNYIDGGVLIYSDYVGQKPEVYYRPEQVPMDKLEGFTAMRNSLLTLDYIREEGFDLYCTASEPGSYDITPAGVDKWVGLSWLAKRLDIPRRNIIAAGNYTNDIEMLQGAGVGVAVANALPQVKEAADYVTKRDNNQDMLVEVVQRFLS